MVRRLLLLPCLSALVLLAAMPAGTAEQTARVLRLHAEVAVESACMTPYDDEIHPDVASLNRQGRVAFCRCFARVVAREATPRDQAALIDDLGIPPEDVASPARRTCMPAPL